jgi:hypothetical protein
MSAELRLWAPIDAAADLKAWAAEAEAGDAVQYYAGLLGHDRHEAPECQRIDRVAATALALADSGRVHLVQRRVGYGRCSYLAIRR